MHHEGGRLEVSEPDCFNHRDLSDPACGSCPFQDKCKDEEPALFEEENDPDEAHLK